MKFDLQPEYQPPEEATFWESKTKNSSLEKHKILQEEKEGVINGADNANNNGVLKVKILKGSPAH